MVWTRAWRAMRVIQVHSRKQRVGPTIEELEGHISAHVRQQAVVTHAEPIHCAESIWVPPIDRSHRARIGSGKRRKRKDAVPIVAAARCDRGEYGVAQPGKYTSALAAVVQGIFLESLGESVARRRSYYGDPKVGPESPGVAFDPLMPLRR